MIDTVAKFVARAFDINLGINFGMMQVDSLKGCFDTLANFFLKYSVAPIVLASL